MQQYIVVSLSEWNYAENKSSTSFMHICIRLSTST